MSLDEWNDKQLLVEMVLPPARCGKIKLKDVSYGPWFAESTRDRATPIVLETLMHMHEWNKYRSQLVASAATFGRLNPNAIKGYATLGGAAEKPAHLDPKTRELIAIAAAVSLRCEGCIAVHTAAACKHGATTAEIAEALGVAVAINAGAALVSSMRALDASDAAGEEEVPV